MNVMLQRHSARYIYVIPEGLKELMTDISREVIRSNPENIYTFIADYLDALLVTRENARVAARLVQSITDIATTTVEFLLRTGMTRSEADKVVNIIQKSFKKFIHTDYIDAEALEAADEVEEINIVSNIIDQADIPPEKGEEAAKIIQNAYRKFKVRREMERELLSGMVDWRVAARSAIRLYRATGVTYEEANRAATLIKAAYKGYYTRKVMRKLAEESRLLAVRLEEEELLDEESCEHDPKVVKIDFASIIPHVDFDESKIVELTDGTVPVTEFAKEDSTTSVVVCSATEEILNLTFEEIKKIERKTAEEETVVEQYPELEIQHEGQVDESPAEMHKEKEHDGILTSQEETGHTAEKTEHTSQFGELPRIQIEGEQDMEVQLIPEDSEKQKEGQSDTEHQTTAEGKSD